MARRGEARIRAAREVDLLSDIWTTAKDCPGAFPLTFPVPSPVSRLTLYSTWRSSENKCSLCGEHFRRVEEGGHPPETEQDADVELFRVNNIHENGLGYGKNPKTCELYEKCVLMETASFLERMRVIIAHLDAMPHHVIRHFSTGCHKVLDLIGPLKRLTAQNPEGWFHVALEMLVDHLILSTAIVKGTDRFLCRERKEARTSVKSIQETMEIIIKNNKEKTPQFGEILARKIKAFVRAPQGGMLKQSLKVLLGCAEDHPEIQGMVFDAVLATLVRVRRRQGPEEQQSFFPTKMAVSRNACVVTWVMTAQTFAVQWCKPVAPPRDFDSAPDIARSILERMAGDPDLWALAEATFLNDPWVTTNIWKLVPAHPEVYKPLHERPVRSTIRRRETQRPIKDPFEVVVLRIGWNWLTLPEPAEAEGASGVQPEDSVGENLMSEERGAEQQAPEEGVDLVGRIRALFEGSEEDDLGARSGEKSDDQVALAEGAGPALEGEPLAIAEAPASLSDEEDSNEQPSMDERPDCEREREDPLASADGIPDEDDQRGSAEGSGMLLEAPAEKGTGDQPLSTARSDVLPGVEQRGTADNNQLTSEDEGPMWGAEFPPAKFDTEEWKKQEKRAKRRRGLLSALMNEGPESCDELEHLAAAGGNWELGDKAPKKKRSVRKRSKKEETNKPAEASPRKKRSAEELAEAPLKKRRSPQKQSAEESVEKPAETKKRKRVSVNYRKKKGPPERHEQGWAGLQDDLMLDILQRVTPKMTSVAALVCKNWRRVCMLDEAWVHHYKQRFGALPKEKPLNKGGQSSMSWFQAFVQRKTAPYFSRFCPDCGRPYLKKSDLDRHMQRAHTATLTCDLCSEVTRFRTEKGLLWHKKEKHEGLKKNEMQPFKCDQCHARCKSQELLDEHRKIMHEGNGELVPFKCSYPGCPFATRLWHNLKRHCTKTHHPLPEPHLPCPKEGCTFRGYNKAAVRQHAFTHASNCPECGRVYAPGYDRWSPHPGMPEIGICDACRIKLHRAELKKRQAPKEDPIEDPAEDANSEEEWQ